MASPSERSPLLPGAVQPTGDVQPNGGTEPGAAEAGELSTWHLLAMFSGVFIANLLASLDSTLVSTLSAPISTAFDNMPILGWLASAYFIASSTSQPLVGKLTDIFGRRDGLVVANLLFTVGNLMCALAQSEWVLIFGRIVAGLGGGSIGPITSMLMSDLIPLRRRGVWQGIGNICFGIGSGIGGPFGGWVNDNLGWRWAFVVQIPVTTIALLLIVLKINIPAKQTIQTGLKRVDLPGALLLAVALVLLLLGLNSGGNLLAWTHPLVLTSLLAAAVAFIAFVLVEEKYAAEPVIPIRQLLNRTAASVWLTNWFMSMSRFGLLFYGPIYFQIQGYSAAETGLRFIPESVAVGITSIFCGTMIRWTGRYYYLSIVFQLLVVGGLALICTLRLDTPAAPPFVYLFLTGSGFSGMLTTSLIALLASTTQANAAVMTSAQYAFRSTGIVIGIAIASAVFRNVLKPQLRMQLQDLPVKEEIIARVEKQLDVMWGLEPEVRNGVKNAYMHALTAVFLTLLGLAAIGVFTGVFMREHKLHHTISRRPSG